MTEQTSPIKRAFAGETGLLMNCHSTTATLMTTKRTKTIDIMHELFLAPPILSLYKILLREYVGWLLLIFIYISYISSVISFCFIFFTYIYQRLCS